VRFYPLSQDLVGEELTATEVDEEFIGELRERWREWSRSPEQRRDAKAMARRLG